MANEPKLKVFEPEVIEETPFPIHEQSSFGTSQSTSGDTFSPVRINQQPLPKKVTSQQVIAPSLNTKSRKILGEYEFTEKGSIQVGKFVQGESGDLRISPDGITARNKDGDTTFVIDGDTGDATFRGDVTVGGDGNNFGGVHVLDANNVEKVTLDKDGIVVQDGRIIVQNDTTQTIIDSIGLVSDTNQNFDNAQVESSVTVNTSSLSYVDVAGSTVTLTLVRPARVLIVAVIVGRNQDFNTGTYGGSTQVYDSFVSAGIGFGTTFTGMWAQFASVTQKTVSGTSPDFLDTDVSRITALNTRFASQFLTNMGIKTFDAGVHNLKLQFKAEVGGTARITNWRLLFIVLGK